VKARFLSKFAVKVLELTGAGLASAIAAYLLAHIGTPPASSLPLVQVTAANDEMMQMVRDECALLVELEKELDLQRKPEQVAAQLMPVPVLNFAKPARATPLRNHKPEPTIPLETKQRTGVPLPTEVAVSQSLPKALEPSPKIMGPNAAPELIRVSALTKAEGEWSSLGMLNRVRGWFLPGSGDPPRPPKPVGESPLSAM
jgi:hypothetical protein